MTMGERPQGKTNNGAQKKPSGSRNAKKQGAQWRPPPENTGWRKKHQRTPTRVVLGHGWCPMPRRRLHHRSGKNPVHPRRPSCFPSPLAAPRHCCCAPSSRRGTGSHGVCMAVMMAGPLGAADQGPACTVSGHDHHRSPGMRIAIDGRGTSTVDWFAHACPSFPCGPGEEHLSGEAAWRPR